MHISLHVVIGDKLILKKFTILVYCISLKRKEKHLPHHKDIRVVFHAWANSLVVQAWRRILCMTLSRPDNPQSQEGM